MTVRLESENSHLQGFRYFWGKHVKSFYNKVHCASCLKGVYAKEVSNRMEANVNFDIMIPEGEIFYICGVASPYKWANNAHLAMKIKEGARSEISLYNGDKIYVDGAEKIHFDEKKTIEKYSHLDKSFTTCRNFQFGVYYFE